jgi:hypothetical protein
MSSRICRLILRRAAHGALPALVLSAGFTANASADVVISTGSTRNIVCASGVCTPTAPDAVLKVTQLVNMLASGNVTINTGGSQASNIVIDAPVSWASASVLTLDAYLSITVNRSVAVTGSGGITTQTNDGATDGTLSFGKNGSISFLSLSSPLIVNGDAYTLVDDITTLASDIAAAPGGNYALASGYNADTDGTYASSPIPTTFTGNFEGLGNTISNLSMNASSGDLGFFANIAKFAKVKNFRLIKVSISSEKVGNVGVLAAVNNGSLRGDSVILKYYIMSGGDGRKGKVIGGLVGTNTGQIETCSTQGLIRAQGADDDKVGGLVGYNTAGGSILDSVANVPLQGGCYAVMGGLVGLIDSGTISNSYATGAVSPHFTFSTIGGLIGSATGVGSSTSISTSYASENVVPTAYSQAGGIVGIISGDELTFSDTYWNTTRSYEIPASAGAGNVSNEPGITGLTTTQLQSGLPTGFSNTIWGQNPNINSGLPYLLAIPNP